jgi:hypothetical protein
MVVVRVALKILTSSIASAWSFSTRAGLTKAARRAISIHKSVPSASSRTVVILLMKSARDLPRKAAR